MDSVKAFAMGQANKDKPMMVFDWNKAAEMIREQKPEVAAAGLKSDWDWTGGNIYRDGKIVPENETYTYLASTWATPELEIDGVRSDCFIMEEDVPKAWGENFSSIYWPQSAIDILVEE